MARHSFATAALAEWSLRHLIAREQRAQSASVGQMVLGHQLYGGAAASLVLLCSLCKPQTCHGALDVDLADLCRNLRAVLDAAAADGDPNTMLVAQLEPGVVVGVELRQAVLAYAVLTLLAALDTRPLCITVCLTQVDGTVSLEIATDAEPRSDTALQLLAQADVIGREAGGELETDSWLLPWSKQLSFSQLAPAVEMNEAPARV